MTDTTRDQIAAAIRQSEDDFAAGRTVLHEGWYLPDYAADAVLPLIDTLTAQAAAQALTDAADALSSLTVFDGWTPTDLRLWLRDRAASQAAPPEEGT